MAERTAEIISDLVPERKAEDWVESMLFAIRDEASGLKAKCWLDSYSCAFLEPMTLYLYSDEESRIAILKRFASTYRKAHRISIDARNYNWENKA